ncbi:MAG: hypothetical protein ABI310_09520 [Microbacteriaceae bacterium]
MAKADRILLAGVIEERSEIPRYVAALGVNRMFVCRLTADASAFDARLTMRHADDEPGLAWHRRRNRELAEILDCAALDDVVIDTTLLTPKQTAIAITAAAGW